jgi:para-nitrobenzyl esterase
MEIRKQNDTQLISENKNQNKASQLSTPKNLIAETRHGRVRGFEKSGIKIFKGIPYGADTGGENRFKAPQAPQAWSGIRDAFMYGPACPQMAPLPPNRFAFVLDMRRGFQSEDCLNLNVWTPSNTGRKRPVMFWIHGGSFRSGSSYELTAYDGESLSRRGDLVVVSIHHRLNVFGHMDLGALTSAPEYTSSVNAGILDIVQALDWVKDNISEFGGDPNNVTVFGQSGGGMKISALFGMPSAKGLFHKAILQSGISNSLYSPEMTRTISNNVLEKNGLSNSDYRSLHDVPATKLFEIGAIAEREWRQTTRITDGFRNVGWAPRIEQESIPFAPFSEESSLLTKPVHMMAGSTLHELNSALWNPSAEGMSEEDAIKDLENLFDNAKLLYQKAQVLYPDQKPVALHAIITSFTYRRDIRQALKSRTRANTASNWMYQFTWETPLLDGSPRSYHGLEIPFVFSNVDNCPQSTGGSSPITKALENSMSEAWIAFSKTGSPQHSGLPEWPEVDKDHAATLVFNSKISVENAYDQSLIDLAMKNMKQDGGHD